MPFCQADGLLSTVAIAHDLHKHQEGIGITVLFCVAGSVAAAMSKGHRCGPDTHSCASLSQAAVHQQCGGSHKCNSPGSGHLLQVSCFPAPFTGTPSTGQQLREACLLTACPWIDLHIHTHSVWLTASLPTQQHVNSMSGLIRMLTGHLNRDDAAKQGDAGSLGSLLVSVHISSSIWACWRTAALSSTPCACTAAPR